MTTALQIILAMGLAAALTNLALDHRRPHPGEFDDIEMLKRAEAQRAAIRRATRSAP